MFDKKGDPFGAAATITTSAGAVRIYRLASLSEAGIGDVDRLPFSIRVLLENLLRNLDGFVVTPDDVARLARWSAKAPTEVELPFKPGRVILQDFTGVPSIVDLAAMRAAMRRLGGDPGRINPQVPCDLVIDHSVQVDAYGSPLALTINRDKEYERNAERYEFLKWGQQALANFRVVPPATGIVHQVNLEYLAQLVLTQPGSASHVPVAFPDSLVGTDSHTTMINGLGVVGWGVGGIEAEAVMLGQPVYMLTPQVVGFRLVGKLSEGATATDLVLTVTQMLRARGVVGKFVEFFGPGVAEMSVADRATVANMAPEYGATMGFFPVDNETLRYLKLTGRPAQLVELVERYYKEQGLFRAAASPDPVYSNTIELNLGTVEPSLAGPKRPQDLIPTRELKRTFRACLKAPVAEGGFGLSSDVLKHKATFQVQGEEAEITHGSLVIAAITSCTNTSNPSVMMAAGLLAKKAVERGLRVKPHVKTSLAPGSRVVSDYLDQAGLTPYLEQLGFHVVGYGCTTCIGNSGPLPGPVAEAVSEQDLVVCAVLSGNRNFEGRINPHVKASFLASPPLVVAYALAGTMDIDLFAEPLAVDPHGRHVTLRDIWPTQHEINRAIAACIGPEQFKARYGKVFAGDDKWQSIHAPTGKLYDWRSESTYIQEPSFFADLAADPVAVQAIRSARCLAMLGDSVTTDHISPAGAITPDSPAGRYLQELGVKPIDFNSYGARRGNDRVMVRGTFANIRLRNLLAPDTEGGVTIHLPDGRQMSIYDAAMSYKQDGVPLIVLAGKEYGSGSSRDWAAKGTLLLGVRAVIAESFERIHRSNLVGMGVLPLQFKDGQNARSLGLTGREIFDIQIDDGSLSPRQEVIVTARSEAGQTITFTAISRIDTPVEVEYYRHGGILPFVLRKLLKG